MAGTSFSMADIAVLGAMIFSALVELEVPEDCTALREWRAMVERGEPQT